MTMIVSVVGVARQQPNGSGMRLAKLRPAHSQKRPLAQLTQAQLRPPYPRALLARSQKRRHKKRGTPPPMEASQHPINHQLGLWTFCGTTVLILPGQGLLPSTTPTSKNWWHSMTIDRNMRQLIEQEGQQVPASAKMRAV